ncbi:DNA repair protein SWI5 homolog isoform X1 [Numida meleagris]|uniref:DNA repair protein SWI5 homolog isoform X1 n=1 Tax=Numida meleagris TaxID=8996 RepID=UPI000B3DE17E|nr:DNA repair protein SWI5 homolog isoform X1 [Numida meleagris]
MSAPRPGHVSRRGERCGRPSGSAPSARPTPGPGGGRAPAPRSAPLPSRPGPARPASPGAGREWRPGPPRVPAPGPPTAEGSGIAVPGTRLGVTSAPGARGSGLSRRPRSAPRSPPQPGSSRSTPGRAALAAGRAAPSRTLCPTSASPARSRGGTHSSALRGHSRARDSNSQRAPRRPHSSSQRAPRRARAGGAGGGGGPGGAVFSPVGARGAARSAEAARRLPAERRCRLQVPGEPLPRLVYPRAARCGSRVPPVPSAAAGRALSPQVPTPPPRPPGGEAPCDDIEALKEKDRTLDREIARLLSEGCSVEELEKHISLLHEYNEIKDAGQMLLGKLAVIRGVTTKQLYPEYDLELND